VRTFEIAHQNRTIGTVKVNETAPASTCLQIIQNSACPQIVVRSLKLGDFAVKVVSIEGKRFHIKRDILELFRVFTIN